MAKPKQKLTLCRDLKEVLTYVESKGWTIEHRKAGHLKLTPPSGGPYFTGSTPSDSRAIRNLISDLRKKGLE